jgi:hypothetical protein
MDDFQWELDQRCTKSSAKGRETWRMVSGPPVPPKGEKAILAPCGKGGSESHYVKMGCGSLPCAKWTPTILIVVFVNK